MLLLSNEHGQKNKSTEEEKRDDKKYALFKLFDLSLKLSPWKNNHSLVRKVAIDYRLFFSYFEKLSWIESMQASCY